MEHRSTVRQPSELAIRIFRHKAPVATGYIKNGNRWGVFIETAFSDIQCEQQIVVQVLPTCVSAKKLQGVEIKALVVHKNDAGFGVELDIPTQEHMDLFVQLLSDFHIQEQYYASVANG